MYQYMYISTYAKRYPNLDKFWPENNFEQTAICLSHVLFKNR